MHRHHLRELHVLENLGQLIPKKYVWISTVYGDFFDAARGHANVSKLHGVPTLDGNAW